MLAHASHRGSPASSFDGDRALRWSWYLFLLSYPWHLLGGGIAYLITQLTGGDFSSGTDVPAGVYQGLYVWMLVPLVASIVVGALAWWRGGKVAALVPAVLSAGMIVVISVFGADQFFG